MLTLMLMLSLFPRIGAVAGLVLSCLLPVHAQDAAALKARHVALRDALAHNAFQRPLYLESSETARHLKGDIYAQIAQPYGTVGPALRDIGHWCDILILHVNVKGCLGTAQTGSEALSLNIGRKYDQPLADAYHFDFLYRVLRYEPDYLRVELNAADGPVGTKHYRMLLEVVKLDTERSFLHLSYAYDFGLAARMAMRGYLATTGRDKRGFSATGLDASGRPMHIGGTRGVIERNTMRYYLAIEAYLGAMASPGPQRLEKRLNDWYTGIERYPEQLHELERGEYLAMKHREVQRLAVPQSAVAPP